MRYTQEVLTWPVVNAFSCLRFAPACRTRYLLVHSGNSQVRETSQGRSVTITIQGQFFVRILNLRTFLMTLASFISLRRVRDRARVQEPQTLHVRRSCPSRFRGNGTIGIGCTASRCSTKEAVTCGGLRCFYDSSLRSYCDG